MGHKKILGMKHRETKWFKKKYVKGSGDTGDTDFKKSVIHITEVLEYDLVYGKGREGEEGEKGRERKRIKQSNT